MTKKEIVLFIVLQTILVLSGQAASKKVVIMDKTHYSNVFGEIRNYRIFLPPGYNSNPLKRYPVIYFYHGWSQRHFGSIHELKADEGESNGGDNIANFVTTHEVIVVKPDGYNRRPLEEYYLRPYNIGPVETFRQFPLYFPELVDHIDSNYKTKANREHRAISGLSMGGFMTFWIAGKYPDLVSAAGNFCGSTEFIVGPQDFPVEYRHQEMYKNYDGVKVRLNYGNEDFIRAYHQDMNKVWTQVMDNYEFKVYRAGHSTCGLGEMFSFFIKTFETPLAKPQKWHHADVYPSFSVWDYQIKSDRNVAGFTIFENVDKRGFKSSSRTFLPDGELLPFVNISVTTPPIYEKKQRYLIHDINLQSGQSFEYFLESNHKGQLKIAMDGGLHEIGINKAKDTPNLVVASFKVKNSDWATHNKKIDLSVSLLNKGATTAKMVTARLQSPRGNTIILSPHAEFGTLEKLETRDSKSTFTLLVNDDKIDIERLKLTIKDDSGEEWNDYIDLHIRTQKPEIKDFIIADGREFAVATAGDDTTTVFLGKGNGDGIVNPGESFVILINDNGRYFRTFLHSTDPHINPFGIHIRESDYWTSYDHVGASAKYSVPIVASDCPNGHAISFFAEYWTPSYPDHIIKRGIINIKIQGKDQTPPQVEWVKVSEDNTIKVKIYDGAKISAVKANFYPKDEQKTPFSIELPPSKPKGYRLESNLIFTEKISEKGFGLYQVEIEAEDTYKNKTIEEWPETVVIH